MSWHAARTEFAVHFGERDGGTVSAGVTPVEIGRGERRVCGNAALAVASTAVSVLCASRTTIPGGGTAQASAARRSPATAGTLATWLFRYRLSASGRPVRIQASRTAFRSASFSDS